MKKILVLVVFHISISSGLYAQNHKLELYLKAAWLQTGERSSESSISTEYVPVPAVEVFYFLKPKIGAGIFYVNSISHNLGSFDPPTYDYPPGTAHYQHYGAALLYSTKRDRRLRFNATAGILKAEQWLDFNEFKTGKSAIGYVAGFGTVIKVTRSIGMNLFNAKFIYYGNDFKYYEGTTAYGLMIDSGLIFKFLRER